MFRSRSRILALATAAALSLGMSANAVAMTPEQVPSNVSISYALVSVPTSQEPDFRGSKDLCGAALAGRLFQGTLNTVVGGPVTLGENVQTAFPTIDENGDKSYDVHTDGFKLTLQASKQGGEQGYLTEFNAQFSTVGGNVGIKGTVQAVAGQVGIANLVSISPGNYAVLALRTDKEGGQGPICAAE